jgi:hypothetical protein
VRSLSRKVRSLIDWLRAGYSDEAPGTGHSPLIALNGPISLSQKQTQAVVDQLGVAPCDKADIGVAITRVTSRLPNESQVHKVAGTLDARGSRHLRAR